MATEWEKYLMLHGWPENGPDSMMIEDLYQLFKARLLEEVVGVRSTHNPQVVEIVPLRADVQHTAEHPK